MRQDQIERLQDLAERVGEVFITEADPENWNGAGVPLRELDDKARGNRYWDKKNAVQTGSLLARILDLRDRDLSTGVTARTQPADADDEIKRFEKQAKELIGAIQTGASAKR